MHDFSFDENGAFRNYATKEKYYDVLFSENRVIEM
jgi:hypothetical protein